MTINVVLLRQTLEQIETHPETWYQNAYRCNTGMCFAGWAAELAGGKWLSSPGGAVSDLLIAEPDDGEDALYRGDVLSIDASARAKRVLGIDEDQAEDLFAAGNDLDELREIVTDLLTESHYVTIEPISGGAPAQDDDPATPSRLAVAEHRPGQPTVRHTSERWIPLESLEEYARELAERIGVPYVTPMHPVAQSLLSTEATS